MSKRKNGEGRSEDVVGGASKKIKTIHARAAEALELSTTQTSAETSEAQLAPMNRELRIAEGNARKKRRKAERRQEIEAAGGKDLIHGLKGKSLRKGTKKHARRKEPGWQVSDPMGGYLVNLDPVFSVDENYLLLAYESSIRIYATNTSVLARELSTGTKQSSISGLALSAVNPSEIYIALGQGLVEKWHWTEGHRLGKWIINSRISGITVIRHTSRNVEDDLVYTVDGRVGLWMITAHHLRLGKGTHQTETQTLFKSTEPISSCKVLGKGNMVIASAGSRLILGHLTNHETSVLKDLIYTWREIMCPDWITTMDARISDGQNGTLGGKTIAADPTLFDSVDLVIGGLRGSLYVYRSLMANLIQKERKQYTHTPVAQQLHWHRTGVGAVKWSADGNYIVSGAVETVLVLWQLDTGQKQYLPHLSAPIESVVVSPSGAFYAVRLADNSAMVLSTTELQPMVSVSGIQFATSRSPTTQVPNIPRVSEPADGFSMFRRPAAAISKSSPGQLLLAVPGAFSSRVSILGTQSAAYLQTLNISSGSQASRQALTRTKVTDKNIGPESNTIEEPNVVLLQNSHDGQWLATVEEWNPPRQDILFLSTDKQDFIEEQISHIEIYLKFWQWHDVSKQWELVSRIEAPHHRSEYSSRATGRILDLVEGPSSSGFATIADDGLVKFWRPKIRYRDGIKVKNRVGQSLTTWSCRQAIPLTALDQLEDHDRSKATAKIALSSDGSLLVAGYQSPSSSSLYLIDTESGDIRVVRPDLCSGFLIGLGIIDQYLITLADNLVVWDIVADSILYEVATNAYGLSNRSQINAKYFAVDQQAKNFVVAIPEIAKSGPTTKIGSHLAVFDPAHSIPIYVTALPRTLVALLPLEQKRGYVTIDSAAGVRTLTPTLQLPSLSKEEKEQPTQPNALEDIYRTSIGTLLENTKISGLNTLLIAGPSNSADSMVDVGDDDVVVVGQHELAEFFEGGNPLALPSVTTLFEQVAGLFSKKLTT